MAEMQHIEQTTFGEILGNGIHKGLASFWMLTRIMVPVYVILTILARTPVLPWIAGVFAPLMKYWGLPGEAATALVLGMTINIHARHGVECVTTFMKSRAGIMIWNVYGPGGPEMDLP